MNATSARVRPNGSVRRSRWFRPVLRGSGGTRLGTRRHGVVLGVAAQPCAVGRLRWLNAVREWGDMFFLKAFVAHARNIFQFFPKLGWQCFRGQK